MSIASCTDLTSTEYVVDGDFYVKVLHNLVDLIASPIRLDTVALTGRNVNSQLKMKRMKTRL